MSDKKPHLIDPSDDYFGAVLNCAVRYALGRRSYMPYLVTSFILPLVPRLSDKTLWCLDKDIGGTENIGDVCDEECWMQLLSAVRAELERRMNDD